jgi:hypothetical protein
MSVSDTVMGLGFLRLEDFATLVLTALGACTVGQLALVAVGTLGEAGGSQRVMRATLGGAGLGVAPLRIRHDRFLSIGAVTRFALRAAPPASCFLRT